MNIKNPLSIFQILAHCSKRSGMKCLLILIIPVIFIACSKEYSCEINCRLGPPVINDTTQADTTLPAKYHYYSASYHVALAGTGSNAWGYTIPSFDTASGILDTVEINMFITLAYYFTLSNNSNSDHAYSINILRKDSLSFDSLILINHNAVLNYGPDNVHGLSSYQDSLSVLNNIELTSIMTTHLNKFTGPEYIAFDYTPSSSSYLVGTNYSINNSFRDSTYILSTYFYKKKI